MTNERRIALIHRVMVPDSDYPKEYAILVTDKHLVLIRQKKVRRTFALRGEMRWGSEISSPVVAKTLKDYEGQSVESLSSDPNNISINNDSIAEMSLAPGEHRYRVHHVNLTFNSVSEKPLTLYLVPLGTYTKPLRAKQSREEIMRNYAVESFKVLQSVLPPGVGKVLPSSSVEGVGKPPETVAASAAKDTRTGRNAKPPLWRFERPLPLPFDKARTAFLADIHAGNFTNKNAPGLLSGLPDFETLKRVTIRGASPHFQVVYEFDRFKIKMKASIDEADLRVVLEAPWWYRGEFALSESRDGNALLTFEVFNKATGASGRLVPVIGLGNEEKKQRAGFERVISAIASWL